MTLDDLVADLCDRLIDLVDRRTLAEGLSDEDCARVYRELAGECHERALGLDEAGDESER